MAFNVNELIQLISNNLWPMIRISGFVLTLPILSSAVTPKNVRVLFVIYLSMIVAPLHPEWPSLLSLTPFSFLNMVQEFFIGLLMGFIIQIVFQAFVLGGQVVAMQAGLGFATLIDPSSKASVPLVSQFYLMLVSLIFLGIDGHLIMIDYLIKSFTLKPIGGSQLGVSAIWELLMFTGWMFKGAIFLALTAIVSLLMVSLSFGIMMKAAPQINIFSVGFPITLMLGIGIVYVSLSSVLPNTRMIFKEALMILNGILH